MQTYDFWESLAWFKPYSLTAGCGLFSPESGPVALQASISRSASHERFSKDPTALLSRQLLLKIRFLDDTQLQMNR
jgi:hypothetical protein